MDHTNPYSQISFIVGPQHMVDEPTKPTFTPNYVKASLKSSADAAGIYSSRIQGRKILLDNPVRESKVKKERQEKRSGRRKHQERKAAGIIGRKEAKEKCVWHFDHTQAKYWIIPFKLVYDL
jgi:hypothetical protein